MKTLALVAAALATVRIISIFYHHRQFSLLPVPIRKEKRRDF
jgi:hypothetical protein